MCGICGIFSKNGITDNDREYVKKMCRSLTHRGPDDERIFVDNHVVLGARRLSIVDVANGYQPISNEDDSIWIVFNGEIYNFESLRKELIGKGHVFKTNTDTEVILHHYEEYGEKCIRDLVGMFSFVIWDRRQQRIFAARDRLGQKPLYYHMSKEHFSFASELNSLMIDPRIENDISPTAIHHYLSLQYIPDPLSIYKGVHKIRPAHYLTLHVGSNIHPTQKRYWDISYLPKLEIHREEAKEEIRRLLTQSVKRRLMSEVPVGAFLSGGVDSSVVVGLMASLTSKPIQTFSVGFENEQFNELPYAKLVSEKWKTEHHEYVITPESVGDIIPKISQAFGEPFADSSAYQTYHLSKFSRNHVTVALNGDGGDEIFAGYMRYWLDKYVAGYAHLPKIVTQNVIPWFLRPLKESTGVAIEKNWIMGLKRMEQVARISPKASIIRWGSFFDESMKRMIYNDLALSEIEGLDTTKILSDDFDHADASSTLEKTLYVDTFNYLSGNNLVKADRMTMIHSLEGRSPLIDHELIEFVAKLPVEWKLKQRRTKLLLKESFPDLLPNTIVNRPKRGFAAPFGEWLKDELLSLVHDMLLSHNAFVNNYFKRSKIVDLVEEHKRGFVNHEKRIWALLILEFWHRQRKERR